MSREKKISANSKNSETGFWERLKGVQTNYFNGEKLMSEYSKSQKNNLETILGTPYISTPMTFSVQRTAEGNYLISSYFFDNRNELETSNDLENKLLGSIVTNPSVIGSNAQVIPTPGKCHDQQSQRLLLKTSSPLAPKQLKTLDFFPIFGSNYAEFAENESTLGLRITNGLYMPDQDTAELGDQGLTIPLIVGPESTVMGQINQEYLNSLTDLGLDWTSIFNIARKVVPIVSKAGYDIYTELTQEDSDTNEENVLIFGSLLKSIVKVTAPIATEVLRNL